MVSWYLLKTLLLLKASQKNAFVLPFALQSEERAFQKGFRQFSLTAEKLVTKQSDKYCYLLYFSSPNMWKEHNAIFSKAGQHTF